MLHRHPESRRNKFWYGLVSFVPLLMSACTSSPPVKALVGYTVYPEGHKVFDPIPGATRDADLISGTMLGMRRVAKPVKVLPSMSRRDWEAAIDDYLADIDDESYALVYVSAHGFRQHDRIYLVDSQFQPVLMDDLLQRIADKAKASIFFIDTCRTESAIDVPLPTSRPLAGKNIVILFSTSTGRKAGDADHSNGVNSKYAKAVADEIVKPQEFRVTLRNIVELVGAEGEHVIQNPWPEGIITIDIFLGGEEDRPPR